MTTPAIIIKLRPSDAHRWLVCRAAPGYVAANQHRIPAVTFDYTEEGQRAHELAKQLLTTSVVPADADLEMLDSVRGYATFVQSQVKKHPGATLIVEQAVPVFYTDRKGYIDAAVIAPDGAHIFVNDYKHGRGVSVKAERNPQLATYALSLAEELKDLYDFTDDTMCHLSIYQPRVSGERAVRTWDITLKELRNYGEWIGAVAADILRAPFAQTFEPGDHQCQFCPAQSICEARARDLLGGADEVLPAVVLDSTVAPEQITPPEPDTLTPEQIGRILAVSKPLTKWLERVWVHAMAVHQQGTPVPGYKLVQSRPGNRKWRDEAEAEKLLRGMFPRAEIVTETLISPAQAEKKMKTRERPVRKSSWEKFNAAIERPEGQATLVPESDERETLKDESAEDHFEDASGDALL